MHLGSRADSEVGADLNQPALEVQGQRRRKLAAVEQPLA
jgi:hypothetical protein